MPTLRYLFATLALALAASLGCGGGSSFGDDDRRAPPDRRSGSAQDTDEQAPPPGDETTTPPPAGGGAGGGTGGGSGGNTGGGGGSDVPPGSGSDGCGDETLFGRCDGNTLVFCTNGAAQLVDCGDGVCGLVNDDFGFNCLDVAAGVLDEENPIYLCEEPNGDQLFVALHARQAIAELADGTQHQGSYEFSDQGSLHLVVPGVVDVTFDTVTTAAGMIFDLSAPSLACTAVVYEVEETIDYLADCVGASVEVGLFIIDTAFEFHADGTLTVFEDMSYSGDEVYSQYRGVYRISGDDVGLAWSDRGTIRSAEGYFDADGFLFIPAFDDPRCDG